MLVCLVLRVRVAAAAAGGVALVVFRRPRGTLLAASRAPFAAAAAAMREVRAVVVNEATAAVPTRRGYALTASNHTAQLIVRQTSSGVARIHTCATQRQEAAIELRTL